MKPLSILIAFFLLGLSPFSALCGSKAIIIDLKDGNAKVTLLKGKAYLVKKDMERIRAIVPGDLLSRGSFVSTDKGSRIELKMPDSSSLRFDELTTFELVSTGIDKKKKKRDIRVNLILGKAWANVSRFFKVRGSFSISTKTAVAGVRGTLYRMNVNKDDSVIIKVYGGEVMVNSQNTADSFAGLLPETVRAARPYAVSGPHPVSIEEWTYIISSMQQIVVYPDGTVTKPFNFFEEEDLNEWVKWNREMDKNKMAL